MSATPTRSSDAVVDADTRFFQLIADGVSRMLGFGVVVVSMRDGDAMRAVAVADGAELGSLPDGTPVMAAGLVGNRWPLDQVTAALADGEDWGGFTFSGRRAGGPAGDRWLSEQPTSGDLARWHPSSALRAPIHGPDGELIGMLGVDLPRTGRLPGAEQLALLDRYVEHTRREILSALGRTRLAERERLLRTARDTVRRASAHPTLIGAVDEAAEALFEGFDVVGLRLRIYDDEQRGIVRTAGQRSISLNRDILSISRAVAEEMWRRGEVAVVSRDHLPPPLPPSARQQVFADLESNDLDSLLHVPLGSGETCWGALALLRDRGAPPWTDAERAVALDIGRDLGQVLYRARTRERQRALIRDLSALDDYQSSLIATVAEQLLGPLQTIEDNLGRVGDPTQGIDVAAIAGIEQGAAVMNRVVEELLLLSRLAHPDDRPNLEILDLRAVARRTTNAAGPEAAARSLALSARVPVRQVRVLANSDELGRMLAELIENALRYTAPGGAITVRLERHGAAASLTVADNGVGIPDDERPHVLTDFFRGAAARGVAPTGAGLGMSIVDRIVRRHGGTVEVESQPGSGTLVRVTLPLAEA